MKIVKTLLAMVAAALAIPIFAAEPAAGEAQKTESETAEKRNGKQRIHELQEEISDELVRCEGKGLISGWKFAPLQVDFGWGSREKTLRLLDETADTVFSFGLLFSTQKSAVFALASLYSALGNNYGLRIGVVYSAARSNYGVSFGLLDIAAKNYGVLSGLGVIDFDKGQGTLCGMNIAGKVLIGVLNREYLAEEGRPSDMEPSFLQIGVFNHGDCTVQIGLLNSNSRSYVPIMPLVNFAMKKDGEK